MLLVEDEIRLFASHSQFYIVDDVKRLCTAGEATFWTKEACDRRLAVGKSLLAIGTGSFAMVRVRVEKHDSMPAVEIALWDHVTEAGLEVEAKLLLIMGCLSNSGLFFEVEPAHYRVRACHANLAESEQEVPSNWTGEFHDWYLLQFWPSVPSEPHVLKHR